MGLILRVEWGVYNRWMTLGSKKKNKQDRILVLGESPLNEGWWQEDNDGDDWIEEVGSENDSMVVSGEMGVGNNNHPVTIKITDEVSGMEMEMAHVKSALLIIEDERKSTAGWLSMVVGDINKLAGVLRFIARATVDELKRLAGRKRG